MKSHNRLQKNTGSLILLFLFSLILISCTPKIDLEKPIGFGLSSKADAEFWAKNLNAQWYYDWGTKEIPSNNHLEYWQTIRVSENGYSPTKEKIIQIAKNSPGHTWIIGNEPDNVLQDNTSPEKYAQIYHELYGLIKSNDRTAKIAIGAISQPTPARLAYLDIVLKVYEQKYGNKLPVDWWNVHGYVLREEQDSWGAGLPVGITDVQTTTYEIHQHGDIQIFQENLINFRRWMKTNGYQDTPLVVSEYGILLPKEFGYTQEFIANYLTITSQWMLNYQDMEIGLDTDDYRLVQKFAWFSLSDPYFPSSNLANLEIESLTEIGAAFKQLSQ